MMIINRVSAAIIAGLSFLGMMDSASALGFGRPTSRAILGESLTVTVPVRVDAGEELTEDCLAADVYFGDDKLAPSAVNATLLPGSGSDRIVKVSTNSLINEPVVTVYVAAGCKSKVSRKFVAFADPPGLTNLPQVAETPVNLARATAAPVRDGSVKSANLDLSQGDGVVVDSLAEDRQSRQERRQAARQAREAKLAQRKAAREQARADAADSAPTQTDSPPVKTPRAKAPTVLAAAPAATDAPRSGKSAKVPPSLSARVDVQPKAAAGARLELDPVEADAVVAPTLTMSAGFMTAVADDASPELRERRAAAAALWAAMNASPEQLARDRQRLQELEGRLQTLQQASAGASEKVAAMEARVQQAEAGRLRHPLVYGLAAACAGLALLAGWLWMRQRRAAQGQEAWWQGQPAEPEGADANDEVVPPSAIAEPSMARTSAEFMPRRAEPTGDESASQAAMAKLVSDASSPDKPAAVPTRANTMATGPVSIKPDMEAVREITVEELIDLEQQAEFFVVLGQDEAALELLESHVQTTAGASPLPYLKLLEIYQRLGRRADYERVQTAFNGRFNAYAPSWESDLQHGHDLEEYPGVVERLQTLWSQPGKAMGVLQSSLTRPDDSVETFDLPAYRELLFLYAVARDLSEREAKNEPVDLVLSRMGDGMSQEAANADDSGADTVVAPLMATRPVKAVPTAKPALSLDLSLDDPAPSGPGGFVDDPELHHGNSIDFNLDDEPVSRKR